MDVVVMDVAKRLILFMTQPAISCSLIKMHPSPAIHPSYFEFARSPSLRLDFSTD
eukprot:m.107348 g.107348  ORF g.107348 m.107348 type:complete len:55 (-) comp13322_c1_seq1:23-187(-)